MKIIKCLLFSFLIILILAVGAFFVWRYFTSEEVYESNIVFYGYNSNNASERFVSNFTTEIDTQCDPNGKFAIVVFGWKSNFSGIFVEDTIQNLLKFRGGCVLFMEYNYYAQMNYLLLVSHFNGIKNVLLKKIKQIARYDQLYLFGFSFGARLCQTAGLELGNQLIDRMDLCDPAGILFDTAEDPKPAAKNVACIDVSLQVGTVFNCHQNFRMGLCGYFQPAANSTISDHELCPLFYNSAFTNDFVPNNHHNCYMSDRVISNVSSNVKMGYNADFDRAANQGDVFIATAKHWPFVVKNGVIDNKP